MRLARFIPVLIAFAGLSSAHVSADLVPAEQVAPAHSVTEVSLWGFTAIAVADEPGASVDVFAVDSDGQVVQVGHEDVGSSGVVDLIVPDSGTVFVYTSSVNRDIRDWLE